MPRLRAICLSVAVLIASEMTNTSNDLRCSPGTMVEPSLAPPPTCFSVFITNVLTFMGNDLPRAWCCWCIDREPGLSESYGTTSKPQSGAPRGRASNDRVDAQPLFSTAQQPPQEQPARTPRLRAAWALDVVVTASEMTNRPNCFDFVEPSTMVVLVRSVLAPIFLSLLTTILLSCMESS